MTKKEKDKENDLKLIKVERSENKRTFFYETDEHEIEMDVFKIENHMVVNFPDY